MSLLSHVALLVPSVENSAKFLSEQGLACEKLETMPGEGTQEIYVGDYKKQSGLLLLVETIAPGPYQRALDKRGPSLHHIGMDVLDLDDCLEQAQDAGWILHPVSEQTIPELETAWFYAPGVPTLIEVHQKKSLTKNPLKITKIDLPMAKDCLALFHELGLKQVNLSKDTEVHLVVDKISLSFPQIAVL